jgi:hypothetical protein
MSPLLVLLLHGASSLGSVCRSRADCSGHGDCLRGDWTGRGRPSSCACDPMYEGVRCDVWRSAPHPKLLRGTLWHNCTHGRPGVNRTNRSAARGDLLLPPLQQICHMSNKHICEQAGAPTVPPPNFTQADCYQKPSAPSVKGGSACGRDFKGLATVLHGVAGTFCARPCVTAQSATCDGCPCPKQPGAGCPCKVMNRTTGKCAYCSGECKAEGHYPPVINPCSTNSSMVCPCAAPPGILARPQCIATDCNSQPTSTCWGWNCKKRLDRRRPLCTLTCDPTVKAANNCQPGATCQPVPGATFSPAGICTFPDDDAGIPTHTHGNTTNQTAQHLPQAAGFIWADYRGAPVSEQCPKINEMVCIQNGSVADGGGQKYCVNAGPYAGRFPYFNIGCMGGCSRPPPHWVPIIPGDPRCHPHPPPPPPPPTPSPPPPPLSTNPVSVHRPRVLAHL